eukprot:TRINITY_DN138_c1_g1_i1.p1 TRINITY_DN138_c1_g1~~TRINITY_DN138_c1_g1_i1.p1  ORF type:complete len:358 (+),score=133.81 TRINITY_DN138_c1_g1_i1:67-1140(+)
MSTRRASGPAEPAPPAPAAPAGPAVERRQRAYASLGEWHEQVQARQKSRCTPEMLDQVRKRAEVQKKAFKSASRAKHLSRCTEAAEKAWCYGERHGGASEERSARGARYARTRDMMQQVQALSAAPCMPTSASASQEEQEDMEVRQQRAMETELLALEEVIDREDAVMQASASPTGAVHKPQSVEDDFRSLCEGLRKEPKDDEECSEKFKSYEKFLETVSQLRDQITVFWDDSKSVFEGRSQQEAEKQIKDIDGTVALGIVDDPAVWFVYLMLTKCQRNSVSMKGVLKDLERKLELLGKQDECPVCLEALADADSIETLSCCHKVCGPCWKYWAEMQHGHAFCPLCRHREFLDVVLQ